MEDLIFHIFKDFNFIDATIYQYGYEKCKPSHSFGPALRQNYLFHYILSGKGILWLENSKGSNNIYNLSKGQGFLIPPNKCCHYIADNKVPWEYAWVEINGLKIEEYLKLSGLSCDTPIFQTDKNNEIKLKKQVFD